MANLDGLDSASLIRRAIALIALALIGIVCTIDASDQFSIFFLIGAWFVCLVLLALAGTLIFFANRKIKRDEDQHRG